MTHTILYLEQTAAYLGRSPDTVRWWIKNDKGPKSFKIGRRRAFLQADIDAWIEEQRKLTGAGGGDVSA